MNSEQSSPVHAPCAAGDYRRHLKLVAWDDLPLAPPSPYHPCGYQAFEVVLPAGQKSLFTGYYEPVLRGSWTADARFRYPLYKKPDELIAKNNVPESGQTGLLAWGCADEGYNLTPYYTRAIIESGALKNRHLELLYADDAVDLFFLHIQGSGCFVLPDGTCQRVTFSAKNGHPYTAIGKILREEKGVGGPMTMPTIKAWLRAHPEDAQSLMNRNASFIFFDLLHGDGPIGASGTLLQAEASLAIDDTLFPYGLPVIVATHDPLDPARPFTRFMHTHDTGSAIRGVVRGDIYFGSGEEAGVRAGVMNAPGRLFVILPR